MKRKYGSPKRRTNRFKRPRVRITTNTPNYNLAKRSNRQRKTLKYRKSVSKLNNAAFRLKEIIIKPPPSGLSHSYTTVKYPQKYGMYKKMSNASIYEAAKAFNVVNNGLGASLQQQVATIESFYTVNGGVNTLTILNQALNYLNNGGVTTSSMSNQTFQRSFKAYLQNVSIIYTFTNEAPGSVEVELYDLIANTTSASYIAPDVAWSTGLSDQEQNNTVTHLFPGGQPTSSKTFNIRWKIKKRTKIELGPGRSHEHVFNFTPNSLIDSEYFVVNGMVKGLTAATLMVTKGMPADTSNTFNSGNIGLANTKIVGYTRTRYTTRILESTPRNNIQVNNLFDASATNLYVINEGSGTVLNTETTTNFA